MLKFKTILSGILFGTVMLLLFSSSVSAFNGLVGGEYMIYPTDEWGNPDAVGDTLGDRITKISVIPYYNNTNIEVSVMMDNGSEITIFNSSCDSLGNLTMGQALDFYDCNTSGGTSVICDPGEEVYYSSCGRQNVTIFGKFVHIVANNPVYVFTQNDGALRDPPSPQGMFLGNFYMIHWAYNGWGPSPYFAIVAQQENVSCIITPINGVSGVSGTPVTRQINGTLTNPGVWVYRGTTTSTGSIPLDSDTNFNSGGLSTLTYSINCTKQVHVVQYLSHLDTSNWIGTADDNTTNKGTLFGQRFFIPSGDSTNPLSVQVFNPNDQATNISMYVLQNGSTNISSLALNTVYNNTVGTLRICSYGISCASNVCNIPARSFGSCGYYISSATTFFMMNSSKPLAVIAGGSSYYRGNSDPPAGHPIDQLHHLYSRVGPIAYNDTLFETPFGISNAGADGHNQRHGGAAWAFYQTYCNVNPDGSLNNYPTNIYFNTTGTVCFNSQGTADVPAVNVTYPLELQGVNTTIYFKNNNTANTSITVHWRNLSMCVLGNATNSTGGTNCTNTNILYTNNRNFSINFTGRMNVSWTTNDLYCINQITLGKKGIFHLSGTDGGYATQSDGSQSTETQGTLTGNHILRLNSDRPFQLYRIGLAACSNSPVEAQSPYMVLDTTVNPNLLIIGQHANVTIDVRNVGGKDGFLTNLVHEIDREVQPQLVAGLYNITLRGIDITNYITFNYSSGCVPTDLHNANSTNNATICVIQEYDAGYPYPRTTFNISLGTFTGVNSSGSGDRLIFVYDIKMVDSVSSNTITATSDLVYVYCSPYLEQSQSTSVRAQAYIQTINLFLGKSVTTNINPSDLGLNYYPNGTIFYVEIKFHEGNKNASLWLKNVTLEDYYSSPVNLTYNNSIISDVNGTGTDNATYTRNNMSYENETVPFTGYVNNRTNGTGFYVSGVLHINITYINNTALLLNITNVSESVIRFVLVANGTVPANITNCVNMSLYVCPYGSNYTACQLQHAHACTGSAGDIKKNMTNGSLGGHNYRIGDMANITINWTSIQPERYLMFRVGDKLPLFMNYTGRAWIRNNEAWTEAGWSANETHCIDNFASQEGGEANCNGNGITTLGQVQVESVNIQHNRRIGLLRLLAPPNMTNWNLIIEVVAIDLYNGTITNRTDYNTNYGYMNGNFGSDPANYEATSNIVDLWVVYFPNATINKTVNQSTAQI
ncbi:MAG: hypothetical protein QMD06_01190, partial [Candidatus Altarchaeum sp.]|nr:hypothetical protein [Candidatus Altarchaeum sp.]